MSHQLQEEDIFVRYRHIVESREVETLHPLAALSRNHQRLGGTDDDHRLPYQRDVDRIVHSKAYARYADKTQVVYLVDNDHVAQRSLHVQLVSQFARGIAAILRLNVELVEAIALGHDVGHPPFGHEGENYLSALSMNAIGVPFCHPWQSCRLFSVLEPLQLGLAVYDGFLCHDGGLREARLYPRFGKGWLEHEQDLQQKLSDPEGTIIPMTLEGCLVKMCDTMSYIGRDLEDAINLGILSREQIPVTCLGNSNRMILSHLARDIIQNSYEKDYIAISQQAFEAIHVLRRFNFDHIYYHPKLKVESPKIERAYGLLFHYLIEDYQTHRDHSHLWLHFAGKKKEAYLVSIAPERMVIDYIACMTDRYFVRTLEQLIVPKRIVLW